MMKFLAMAKHAALPAIVSTCTAALVCTDYELESGDKERYMVADVTISCSSDKYKFLRIYAWVMAVLIMVFEIGLGYLLFSKKKIVRAYDNRTSRDGCDPVYDFLVSRYRCGFTWFVTVENIRRCCTSFLLVFSSRRTQLLVALCVNGAWAGKSTFGRRERGNQRIRL
mmetsp:Transcript_70723/g.197725  ORF Transcript_70723/g.197725 Transcript_70723/m.197725 type:complete len:168 (+) Transcript_70723:2620-3123(+)